uniref:Uncharacterized protein n=1 Tax=Anopheles merus TaxID=30066 RepID=A0A182VI87_ANOME
MTAPYLALLLLVVCIASGSVQHVGGQDDMAGDTIAYSAFETPSQGTDNTANGGKMESWEAPPETAGFPNESPIAYAPGFRNASSTTTTSSDSSSMVNSADDYDSEDESDEDSSELIPAVTGVRARLAPPPPPSNGGPKVGYSLPQNGFSNMPTDKPDAGSAVATVAKVTRTPFLHRMPPFNASLHRQ